MNILQSDLVHLQLRFLDAQFQGACFPLFNLEREVAYHLIYQEMLAELYLLPWRPCSLEGGQLALNSMRHDLIPLAQESPSTIDGLLLLDSGGLLKNLAEQHERGSALGLSCLQRMNVAGERWGHQRLVDIGFSADLHSVVSLTLQSVLPLAPDEESYGASERTFTRWWAHWRQRWGRPAVESRRYFQLPATFRQWGESISW